MFLFISKTFVFIKEINSLKTECCQSFGIVWEVKPKNNLALTEFQGSSLAK